jgi:XTP/dITP diphosphohydrolase
MRKLIFATGNQNKVAEVNVLLNETLEILSLKDLNFEEELREDYDTLEENARQKALFIHQKFGLDCFSEDSGLEINALGGRPGVNTAHYSGSRDADENMDLVLQQLANQTDRSAQFRAVLCLVMNGEVHQFEGICKGNIALEKSRGAKGFGYDPIFVPEGYDSTFADLSKETKGSMSHRGKAMKQLIDFLKNIA